MKPNHDQLLAAYVEANDPAVHALASQIVCFANELSAASAADVAVLASCLNPDRTVAESVKRLYEGMAAASQLRRDLPGLRREALAEIQTACDAAHARCAAIQTELDELERTLKQTLNSIDRPGEEWKRWQDSGLTRNEILARGGVEPTWDASILVQQRQAAHCAYQKAADQLMAERKGLRQFINCPSPLSIPDSLRTHWKPSKRLLNLVQGASCAA